MHNENPEFHEDFLHEGKISRLVEEALMEDIGVGDVTTDSIVPPDVLGEGVLTAKSPGIVSGLGVAALVFNLIDEQIHFHAHVEDGYRVKTGDPIARVHGSLASILKGERTALNILQRMSGISTMTRTFVDAVEGTRAKIIDTRKTAPGLRILDKLAVRFGGGSNHRFGLDDMVLIKDNHIAAAGSVSEAITRCYAYLDAHGIKLPVEVETKNIDEVREVLGFPRVDRIMLDNFQIDDMRAAVKVIGGRLQVEASGNVNLTTVRAIAETGVDLISVGALTHSFMALDISLNISTVNITAGGNVAPKHHHE